MPKPLETETEDPSLEKEKQDIPQEHPEEEKDSGTEVDALKSKLEKLESEFQKRINQEVSRRKSLEDKLQDHKPQEDSGEQVKADQLRDHYDSLMERLNDVEDQIDEARDGESRDKLRKLRNQRRQIERAMDTVEDEFKTLEKSKKVKQDEAKIQKNREQWDKSFMDAVEEFPELMGKDGKLKEDSPLLQAALRLMGQNTKTPKFAKWAQAINPKYDHENGPLTAVIQASRTVRKDQSKAQENKLEQENKSLKAREQMVSEGRPTGTRHPSEVTQKHLDSLEKKAVDSGMKSDWRTYLNALARYQGRR